MKSILPIFVALGLLLAIGLTSGLGEKTLTNLGVLAERGEEANHGQEEASRRQEEASRRVYPGAPMRGDKPRGSLADISGQQLMAAAAAAALRQRSISAKIRLRIDLFGHQLVGSGSYQQLVTDQDMLLRLELKIQVGDRVASFQQVSDGDFLWVRHDVADNIDLGRIDLRQAREAIASSGQAALDADLNKWIALGGLPHLLRALSIHFQFDTAHAARLSDIPVWELHGRIQREKLDELLDSKDTKQASEPRLSEHLPESVIVVLAQDDLFPYRIEYLKPSARPHEGEPAESTGGVKPIVTMELFEVRVGAPIDPLRFVYKQGNQDVTDRTEAYLKSIGIGATERDSRSALKSGPE